MRGVARKVAHDLRAGGSKPDTGGVPGHADALDAVRRAHDDDDAYAAYARRRKGAERPQPSASHANGHAGRRYA
jgi:hypothetical protein